MPLFIDRHEITNDLTPEDIARLHVCDLDIAGRFGVRLLTYWYHSGGQTAFCLGEAPTREAMETVHRESHGYMAADVIEVDWRTLESFMGRIREPERGEPWEDVSMRTILCTEIDEPDGLSNRPGSTALRLFQEHDRLATAAIRDRGGRGVKPGGEGIIGCFISTAAALESAIAIRHSSGPLLMQYHNSPVRIRIGIATGEPVFGKLGLFEAALREASEICLNAEPGDILVSGPVRDLSLKDGYEFIPRGHIAGPMPGAPMRLFKLEGKNGPGIGNQITFDLGKDAAGGLSPREIQVLQLIAAGRTSQEIADLLFISLNTVNTHVRKIFEKTDSANRAEAASFALRHRLA